MLDRLERCDTCHKIFYTGKPSLGVVRCNACLDIPRNAATYVLTKLGSATENFVLTRIPDDKIEKK